MSQFTRLRVGRWLEMERMGTGDVLLFDTGRKLVMTIERKDFAEFLRAYSELISDELDAMEVSAPPRLRPVGRD